MILTGNEIKDAIQRGDIHIKPDDISKYSVGANSIDVRLNPSLRCYDEIEIDSKKNNKTNILTIPEEGLVLMPDFLYLASTNESVISHKYVPVLDGVSSVGRLGISIHQTAGYGDVGWGYEIEKTGFNSKKHDFCHISRKIAGKIKYPTWTLEISCIQPVRIYPNMRIGQVRFHQVVGEPSYYGGKYNDQKEPTASKMYKEFN